MISDISALSEVLGENVINSLGFTEEYFFSLPFEYQNALLKKYIKAVQKDKKKKDLLKIYALKKYNFEENVKKKVLVLLKKK